MPDEAASRRPVPASDRLLPAVAIAVVAVLLGGALYVGALYAVVLPRFEASIEGRARTISRYLASCSAPTKPRVYVVGASIVAEALDAHIAEATHRKRHRREVEYVNLGVSADMPITRLPHLPGIIRCRPSVVVYGVSIGAFNRERPLSDPEAYVAADRFEGFGSPSWEPIVAGATGSVAVFHDALTESVPQWWWRARGLFIEAALGLVIDAEPAYIRATGHANNWKDPWLFDLAPLGPRRGRDGRTRVVAADPRVWDDFYEGETYMSAFALDDFAIGGPRNRYAEAFRYFLDALVKLRAPVRPRVIVVSMPLAPLLRPQVSKKGMERYLGFLRKETTQRGIALAERDHAAPNHHFVDYVHASAAGRQAFSRWLPSVVEAELAR